VINAIDGVDAGKGASDIIENAGTLIATLFKDGSVHRIGLEELE
jgi:hypothetical protein